MNRIKQIFSEALETHGEDRSAYLDRACGDDRELRAEVEAYLSAAEGSDALLGNTPDPGTPLSEQPGTMIGRYKLLEQIGEGGFGVVFMAEQEHPVRRKVALKIIKLGMDTKQVVARFEAERQALAMMDHPNIARVFDGGSTETGRPYFVMELVKGIPITQYCDQTKLTTRDRLQLFISVCGAVQHAHQKGIIHRDLKPNNVMVCLHDDKPVVKIIDFGVAKATQSKLTERTLFTGFRQMIGTPAYMSPEQAQMSALDVDTRSDIYSLGVLLYELLTSTTPFDGKQLMSAAYDEMQRMIREVDPPPPSTRLSTLAADTIAGIAHLRQHDPKHLAQSLKGDLDWIVMRCLEKDRTRRYETANGLAMDLQRYMSDEPVQARPPTPLYRIRKFARRNRIVVAAGSVVTAALICGFGVATWMFLRERQSSSRAMAAEQAQSQLRRQAQTEAAKSQQVAQLLKEMLGGVGPYVAVGRDTTLLRDILDKTAERIGRDLKGQPEVEAELRDTIGSVYAETGPEDKAEAMIREALRIRRSLPGDHRLEAAACLHSLGLALWRQDRLAEAEAAYREALATRRELLPDGNWEVPSTLANLGAVLMEQGRLAEAEKVEQEALQLARKRAGGNDDQGIVWALSFLGNILNTEGKLAEAEGALREAIAMAKRVNGNSHPTVSGALRFLAYTLHHANRLAEAESVAREALAIDRMMSDKDRNPSLAWSLDELAAILNEQGRLAEAEDLLREALAIQRQVLGNQNKYSTTTFQLLIDVLRKEGKLAEADKLSREIPASATRSSPTTPP